MTAASLTDVSGFDVLLAKGREFNKPFATGQQQLSPREKTGV